MKTKIIYQCPEKLVTVIQKSEGLRRFPPSKYACGLFILRAKTGTRVIQLANGDTEFMPSFDELRAMLEAIDPQIAALFPQYLKNKPQERRQWWAQRNRNRKRAK